MTINLCEKHERPKYIGHIGDGVIYEHLRKDHPEDTGTKDLVIAFIEKYISETDEIRCEDCGYKFQCLAKHHIPENYGYDCEDYMLGPSLKERRDAEMKCEMCDQPIGDRYAFTAVIDKSAYHSYQLPYRIGKAIVGRRGYLTQAQYGGFETYDEAVAQAEKLNKKIGLTPKEAWMIVAKTTN